MRNSTNASPRRFSPIELDCGKSASLHRVAVTSTRGLFYSTCFSHSSLLLSTLSPHFHTPLPSHLPCHTSHSPLPHYHSPTPPRHGHRQQPPGSRKAPRRIIPPPQHDLIPSPFSRERWQTPGNSSLHTRSHPARQRSLLSQDRPLSHYDPSPNGPLLASYGGSSWIRSGAYSVLSKSLSDTVDHRCILDRP